MTIPRFAPVDLDGHAATTLCGADDLGLGPWFTRDEPLPDRDPADPDAEDVRP